ncbi:sodium/calcium exchanger regulatory protein 1-like isoform X2 [Gigantopelta aegis]|uniref:sodium/calcium exchanger regulatory protein 1-like isoform X2 n=1 Tax=Gigantopelta aegis TaxID=1735272 RepID=UPI001B88C90A|nr:sodium/calcium exchanger regulatory protein 1-like isoform X2 [Gigantopelta aegis]
MLKKIKETTKGVGYLLRKMASAATPTQEITVDGDHWHIKTITTFKTTELDFKIGEPFEETTGDGRKVKATCTLDGQKLTHEQKGEPSSIITREFDGTKMNMVLTTKNVECTRKYEKLE